MLHSKDELEEFKIRIDLRAYAASQGYQLDKSSWRGSAVMRHPVTNDKVIIKLDHDGHHIYFSVRDDRDNGSIIDWIQRRNRGMKLGAVRLELRPWLGQNPVPVPSFPSLPKTSKNRLRVEAHYTRMREASEGHPYLERERAIPPALLTLERFTGRVRIDDRGNAVFPHFDHDGLCGFELKNKNFTGFSSGGTKAIWSSQIFPDDNKLVLCEGAIDGLSYALLHPDNRARYASIGGQPNPQQMELIRAAIASLPAGSETVAAMDNDAAGKELNRLIRKAFDLTGRQDLRFTIHEPVGGKDWNDILRAKPDPLLPYRPEVASITNVIRDQSDRLL